VTFTGVAPVGNGLTRGLCPGTLQVLSQRAGQVCGGRKGFCGVGAVRDHGERVTPQLGERWGGAFDGGGRAVIKAQSQ